MAREGQEGREQELLVNARYGYAYYLSCAVTETNEALCLKDVESISNLMRARDYAILGWEAAKVGWPYVTDSERNKLAKLLGAKKQVPTSIYRTVFQLIGGTERGVLLPDPRGLRNMKCDLAQGNYFSEPLPSEALADILEEELTDRG
jgi:hypothetical protein